MSLVLVGVGGFFGGGRLSGWLPFLLRCLPAGGLSSQFSFGSCGFPFFLEIEAIVLWKNQNGSL